MRIRSALLAGAVLCTISFPSFGAQTKPNIVVIMTDDQDDIGSLKTMPRTHSELTTQGVRFLNSFAQFPVCGPARASLLTGQLAHNNGMLDNSNPSYGRIEARENETLGVWLQRAGYRTAMMGKILNGWEFDVHVLPGWDDFRGLIPRKDEGFEYFGFKMMENGSIVRHAPEEYVTDYLADEAVDFIRHNVESDKPLFLLVTPNAPHKDFAGEVPAAPRDEGAFSHLKVIHRPNFNEANVSDKPHWISDLPLLTASEQAAEDQRVRDRREALLAVDDLVARVLNAFGSEVANTLIILSSDNGFSLGSHRWDSKYIVYDESIRTPLIIRGPGVPTGEQRTQLVTNMDLVATVLDYGGATATNPIDGGKSLRPLMADQTTPWRTAFLVTGEYPKWENKNYQAVRTEHFLYAKQWSRRWGYEEEFYTLDTDPYQNKNRIDNADWSPTITSLRGTVDELDHCSGKSCWYVDVPSSNR